MSVIFSYVVSLLVVCSFSFYLDYNIFALMESALLFFSHCTNKNNN